MKNLATSLLVVAVLGAACGHDELWLGSDAGTAGGAHSGGTASKAGKPDAAAGATSGGSGGNAGSGSGGAGATDASSDALADADSASDGNGDADADADGDGAVAVVSDFSLEDVNPASSLYQKKVSPKQFLGQISAWYFGHAT